MFHKFQNKLLISADLTAQTALRIGGSKDTQVAAPDLPVVRDASGKPYIPGSSLKGVMRSYMESLIRGIAGEAGACDPTDQNKTCVRRGSPKDDGGVYYKTLRDQSDKDDEKLAKLIAEKVCLCCAVFGSQVMSARIGIKDAAVDADLWFDQFQVRNGVAINRDSGKAADGMLYDFEVIPPGTVFHFELTLENSDDWMRGLVVSVVNAVAAGDVRVGGAASRGLGVVSLNGLSYKFIADAQQLLDCLDNGGIRSVAPLDVTELGAWTKAFRNKLKEVSNVQAAR